jgi:hypothetical protein
VEDAYMCAKGINIQLCAKPKSKIKDGKSKIIPFVEGIYQ